MVKSGQLETRPHCPTCKKLLDGFIAVDHEHIPKPGDLSICAYCSEVLQFTEDMSFKQASVEAIEEFGLLGLSRAQRQVREFGTLADKIKARRRPWTNS